jgi:hypothetical protein
MHVKEALIDQSYYLTHTPIVFDNAADHFAAFRAHGGPQVRASEGLQLRWVDGTGDHERTAFVTRKDIVALVVFYVVIDTTCSFVHYG